MKSSTLILFAMALAFWPSPFSYAQSLIQTDGSSTVFPITDAVAKEFKKINTAQITVGISGTGGGFKKFCNGETDVQNASRPILKAEMELCKKAGIKYFEFPVAYDAIVVAVSPKNNWAKDIQVSELKKIWEPAAQDKVLKWNQVRKAWPDVPLKLLGAASDSGTFDYFTEAVVGKAKSGRSDYIGSEDYNTLVLGISLDENSMGYVPYAYYERNKEKLKAVRIIGDRKWTKKIEAVAPTRTNVENGKYYPLARPVFIYVSATSAERSEVKDFIKFYLTHAQMISEEVKYIPLPQKAYTTAISHFEKGKLGTVFDGKAEIGLKIEDLLKREAKH